MKGIFVKPLHQNPETGSVPLQNLNRSPPAEKEISKNETLNIDPSPVRIFITNAIRIEVMPECPPELFHVLIQGLKDHA